MASVTRGFVVMVLMMWSPVNGSSDGNQGLPRSMRSEVRRHAPDFSASSSLAELGQMIIDHHGRPAGYMQRTSMAEAEEKSLQQVVEADEKAEEEADAKAADSDPNEAPRHDAHTLPTFEAASALQDPDDEDDPKHLHKTKDDDGSADSGDASASDADSVPTGGSADSVVAGGVKGSELEDGDKLGSLGKDATTDIEMLKKQDAADEQQADSMEKDLPKDMTKAEITKEEQQDMSEVNEEMAAEKSGKVLELSKKALSEQEPSSFASSDDDDSDMQGSDFHKNIVKMMKANWKDHQQDEKEYQASMKDQGDASDAEADAKMQKDDESLAQDGRERNPRKLDVSLSERDAAAESLGAEQRVKAEDQAETKAQAKVDAEYASAMQQEMAENAHPGADEEESARVQKIVEQKRLASLKGLEGQNNGIDDSVSASLVGGVEQSGVKDSIFNDDS